jgi:hypothetical protein
MCSVSVDLMCSFTRLLPSLVSVRDMAHLHGTGHGAGSSGAATAGGIGGGGSSSNDAALLLEAELRELVTKMQRSFTDLLHPSTSLIGESFEDKTTGGTGSAAGGPGSGAGGGEDENLDEGLQALFRIGEASTAQPPLWAVGSTRASGLADERLAPVPARKAVPVQKISYQQLQASAVKQAYQTSVHANSLVHHAQGLLGLVSRLKLSGILAEAALDATRRERGAAAAADPATAAAADDSAAAPRHPLEAAIHPSNIPPHLLPLHLQRTQQQLHDVSFTAIACYRVPISLFCCVAHP